MKNAALLALLLQLQLQLLLQGRSISILEHLLVPLWRLVSNHYYNNTMEPKGGATEHQHFHVVVSGGHSVVARYAVS